MPIDLSSIYPYLQRATFRPQGYIHCLCPYHPDRKPSLIVGCERFKCMAESCGKSGRTEELYEYVTGKMLEPGSDYRIAHDEYSYFSGPKLSLLSYSEENLPALEQLAMDAHIALTDSTMRFGHYLEQRGLTDRIEPQFLGWYRGWYTVPVFNPEHEFIGLVLRASPDVENYLDVRFCVPPGQVPMLYAPDWRVVTNATYLIVVFGLLDALTLCDLRKPVVTSTGGVRTLKATWLKNFRRRIYVLPDKNEAGFAKGLIRDLDWRGKLIELDYPEHYNDPNDYFKEGKREVLLRQLTKYT